MSTLSAPLAQPLQIGSLTLRSRVFQSPLSGVTDLVFRRLVRRYAPESMVYTEMVQAAGICRARELPQLMEIDPDEQPVGVQLFDCRPDFIAEATEKAIAEGAATIDLNMGCPVNKITKNGGGSSLLRDPETAVAIVRAAISAAGDRPVTVKTRIGWDDHEITILDFAQRLQDAGAAAITIHGRTRAQGYTGSARWDWIARVKATLSIPVIANGDITSVDTALQCLHETGADGVMCSRGTLGYPFLVGEIDALLRTGERRPPATPIARLQCAREHLAALYDYKGDRGIRQARKHLAWYATGWRDSGQWRDRLCQVNSVAEGWEILDQAIVALQISPEGDVPLTPSAPVQV